MEDDLVKKRKMALLHAILFPMFFAILCLIGQQNSFSRDTDNNHDFQECKRAIENIRSVPGAKNSLLNMCEFALKQPNFSLVINEQGAVVVFNEKGSPIYGQTSRLIDYTTKNVYPARRFTDTELNDCREKLISYYKALQRDGAIFKTIVIFSTSLKKALCEAVTNKKKGYVYFGKREGTALKIYRKIRGKLELIAAEQIFFAK